MKEMTVNPLGRLQPGIDPAKAEPSPTTGFKEVLEQSIDTVNKALNEAEQAAAGLVSGQHSNIHETMIAMEKANISFRLMTKMQNKAIEAYQEIMRLQL